MSASIGQIVLLVIVGIWGILLASAAVAVTAWLVLRRGRPAPPRSLNLLGSLHLTHPAPDSVNQPPKPWVGRSRELSWLLEGFDEGVVIGGKSNQPGTGKTALGRALAHRLKKRYPGGCIEIDLDGGGLLPEQAMRRILHQIEPSASLPEGEAELGELYRAFLGRRGVLLLLDNARDTGQIRGLLPPQPSAVIATVLNGKGDKKINLPVMRINALPVEEAVLLLQALAGRLKNSPAEELRELAQQCGGLPLALRLAGSLLKNNPNWSAGRLVERMKRVREQERWPAAEGGYEVQTLLVLAYEALDDILQYRLRMLGAFGCTFSAAGAAHIWGCEKPQAQEDIGKLWFYGLLEWQDKSRSYALHEAVRAFARKKLFEHPSEAQQAALRHARYYLQQGKIVSDHALQSKRRRRQETRQFRELWPELQAAWLRMTGREPGWPRSEDSGRWLFLATTTLWKVLVEHLPEKEWRPWFESAMEAVRGHDDRQEAQLSLLLGRVYAERNEAEWAKLHALQALVLFLGGQNRAGEAEALALLGFLHQEQGDLENGQAFLGRALEILRELPEAEELKRRVEFALNEVTAELWEAGRQRAGVESAAAQDAAQEAAQVEAEWEEAAAQEAAQPDETDGAAPAAPAVS